MALSHDLALERAALGMQPCSAETARWAMQRIRELEAQVDEAEASADALATVIDETRADMEGIVLDGNGQPVESITDATDIAVLASCADILRRTTDGD